MLSFFKRKFFILVLSLGLALIAICHPSHQAQASILDDAVSKFMMVYLSIFPGNTELGWGSDNSLSQQYGQVQGQVSAEINSKDNSERVVQELQPLAPGVMGAEVSLNKEVNGTQVHASSSIIVHVE